MPRARHANPSDKAKESRTYRKNQKDQKRFESPLRQFIEIKYKNIFQEYVQLYNRMDAENPSKNDLKKSEMFKRWKVENQKANTIDVLSLAIKETIEASDSENNSETIETSDNENETTAGVDVLLLAMKETVEASDSENNSETIETSDNENETTAGSQWASDNENNVENTETIEASESEGNQRGQDEGMLAAQQVDELVNQMIIDEELREILNAEPYNDEGIELNIEDELGLDIEDFDYRLEVELNNW